MKFKERILQPSSTKNAKVIECDDRAHHAISGTKCSIKAQDSVIGANSQQLRDKILQ